MGRCTAGKTAYAAQHRALGDPSGGEHHIARRKIQKLVFSIEIGDAETLSAAALVIVAEQEPPLHLTADAAQCCRRQYPFGSAARADIHVDPGLRIRCGDDAAYV